MLLAGFLVHLGGAGDLRDPSLQDLQVREDQLERDRLDVPQGIDRAVHVNDVAVLKAPDDVNDRVALADVGEELVAESLSFGCAFDESRDINELDHGGGNLFRVIHLTEKADPLIRDRDDADVRIDRAEGVVRGLGTCLCERVKQRAFADVRESDDS